ncbi:tRNA lysidine(34) synthetase TilS [Methylobacterium sp. WSM2598]|uniref:tRNA lysidine(34) synthetase TilS n=1 Tax=Methylobacterium sp. WSM2598 TaxID=398261 RepID=UPI00037C950C|nr:tRNA lysidine(34) synthetase TilS [Methylobacterium sp. WSM2598]
MSDAARPLDPDEAARRLGPWLGAGGQAGGVVLAVSGGPDSTALMGCAAALPPRVPVLVATVDHGLRPESGEEAAGVAALAGRLGLPHRILTWRGEKPRTRLQEAARAARYDLLLGLAREAGAGAILTAHTLDDQAETVLMRLCAGSGPAGLAGIAPARRLGGLLLGRPFLDLPKARLVATCAAAGWPFAVDPGNAAARFARARLRRVMPLLAAEGLTPARLARLAARLRRNEAALAAAAEVARPSLAAAPAGPGRLALDAAGLAALPEAVALRVLADAIAAIRAGERRPERLERLEEALFGRILPAIAAGTPLRLTLGGALLDLAGGRLLLAPEPPRRRTKRAG